MVRAKQCTAKFRPLSCRHLPFTICVMRGSVYSFPVPYRAYRACMNTRWTEFLLHACSDLACIVDSGTLRSGISLGASPLICILHEHLCPVHSTTLQQSSVGKKRIYNCSSATQLFPSSLMAHQTVGLALIAVVFFVIRYLNGTDAPKIKGLPEVPGVPIFGSLLQLGDVHAKRAGAWVKKFGPVFQVRLGNRVCEHACKTVRNEFTESQRSADSVCKHLRERKAYLDHQPVCPYLPPYPTHLPYRCILFSGIHHRHIPMG